MLYENSSPGFIIVPFNFSDANTILEEGDSLEVQIDPNSTSVFTIFAVCNLISFQSTFLTYINLFSTCYLELHFSSDTH